MVKQQRGVPNVCWTSSQGREVAGLASSGTTHQVQLFAEVSRKYQLLSAKMTGKSEINVTDCFQSAFKERHKNVSPLEQNASTGENGRKNFGAKC